MSDIYRLSVTPGLALVVPMLYQRAGVPAQVDDIKAQIWTRRTGGALVATLSSYFEQASPGGLVLTIPPEATQALAAYIEAELWWDAYATVAGTPIRLISPSPVLVHDRISTA